MKINLISKPDRRYNPIVQVLLNRGIPINEISHYLNLTDDDILSYNLLGENKLRAAATYLINCINNDESCCVVVDCDCDGYASSAILINYLYNLFPAWVSTKVKWLMHTGKQHGLMDQIDTIMEEQPKLVICPDSASNDYECHSRIKSYGGMVICLDHHEADKNSPDAIVINNQLSEYPNKAACGGCVTWQFCRYLDSLLGVNYADKYLDLVAYSLVSDMMDMRSFETRYLTSKGFEPDRVTNPFLYGMWQKNAFKLGDRISNIGCAFYITPLGNCVTRSGTQEEKELLFKSMLNHCAFQMILSDKRGHKLGEQERVIDQALRMVTRVKTRQTKAQDDGMEYLENMIAEKHLNDHKVLLFLLNDNTVSPAIRGLAANKLMAKYQKPVAVLTKHNNDNGVTLYEGSCRGYSKTGVESFKDICEETGTTEYLAGHANAFGCGIKEDNVATFLDKTDAALSSISTEPAYNVDYLFEPDSNAIAEVILKLADYDYLYGQEVDEPLFAIHNIKVSTDMITIMKGNTLKITLPNGIPIIKFNATEEEIEELTPQRGTITLNIVARGNKNEWNGNISAQLMLVDYEIKEDKPTSIVEMWGF